MPKRIQRKRTKGWRMPEGAVYVGRPTKWGNMYKVIKSEGVFKVVMLGHVFIVAYSPRFARHNATVYYRDFLDEKLELVPDWLEPLRGKDLACWCPLDQPCHADVLLKFANSQPVDQPRRRR